MKKKKIASRLFGLISLSLIILFGVQLIFQTLFLEGYYTNSKKQKIARALVELSTQLKDQDTKQIEDELLRFSQEFQGAAAVIDLNGSALYGLGTQKTFMDVKGENGQAYRISLEGFLLSTEDMAYLEVGNQVSIAGFESSHESYQEIYPIEIKIEKDGETHVLGQGYRAQAASTSAIPSGEVVEQRQIMIAPAEISTSLMTEASYVYPSRLVSNLEGWIEQVYLPDEKTYGNGYREYKIIEETRSVLMDLINEESVLTLYEPIMNERIDTYIGVKHLIGIVPIELEKRPVLLVAMISLQGVKEAVGVMNQYAILFFGGAVGVALLIAYGYAKRFTKPLVELRNVTTHIANLDFEHRCYNTTSDEIGELGDNINKMAGRLKESLESMQRDIHLKNQLEQQRKQLISNVSHELKTPLTVMKGTCCGLMDGVYDVSDPAYLEGMLGQIDQMSELIVELLEVSRLENEVQLSEEVWMLSDVVLKVHRHLKPLVRERRLQVELDIEEYLVRGDRKRIETVIRNFYNNAVFYTPEGERIVLVISQQADRVRFAITNYGTSISPDRQAHLWDAFYRIDESRNKALGGSGLGLYMVKQILEKHESAYGMGSKENEVTFWFELPVIIS